MYYLIYAIGRIFWTTSRPILELLSNIALQTFVKLGAAFVALMTIYIIVRYVLAAR